MTYIITSIPRRPHKPHKRYVESGLTSSPARLSLYLLQEVKVHYHLIVQGV